MNMYTPSPALFWFTAANLSRRAELSAQSWALLVFLSPDGWRGMACLTSLAIIAAGKLMFKFEMHTSIREKMHVLFCHFTSLSAVLLTGRWEKILSSGTRNFFLENLFKPAWSKEGNSSQLLAYFCKICWFCCTLLWNSRTPTFTLCFFVGFFLFEPYSGS